MNSRILKIRLRALRSRCPKCDAPSGKRCRSKDGRPLIRYTHRKRKEAVGCVQSPAPPETVSKEAI
jgi:hypothetical protein